MLHAALLVLHLHAAVQERINVSQSAYSKLHPLHSVFLCSSPLWHSPTSLYVGQEAVKCKCRSHAQSGRPREAGTD